MADKILLVQNDTLPKVAATILDDATGDPVDITGATPRLYFREAGAAEILDTLEGVVTDGPGGGCLFAWNPTTLDVDAGDYEGEIEITFQDGTVQTVYAILKFKVREQFA